MFTINEINVILGVGHDCQLTDLVRICFHEGEDGETQEITVLTRDWKHRFRLENPAYTAHLPASMTFRRVDFNALFRKLQAGYKNFNILLPLKFSSTGFEVLNGPARGTKIFTQEEKP